MTKFGPRMEVDLHGANPDQARRRLAQALHLARVKGAVELLVITGRGLGNPSQSPILRREMERWLRGPDGRRAGVLSLESTAKGGALLVRLTRPGGKGAC